MSAKKFYVTTAIDYVNSLPHIGTAYEKIGADVLARFRRMSGEDVHFQMGNDEHSMNVQRSAEAKGMSPKAYCDEMRKGFESIWKKLDISYDGFIQTSDPNHEAGVKKFFSKILESGDIYKKRYEGWYCESCEAFLMEKDLVEELCPNHKSKPKWLSEENYFFSLSKYEKRLLAHIDSHPEFILPDVRRNEILSLLHDGLQDISISRSSFTWGIPLPNDPAHVVYVWFDALINYITAVGYGWDDEQFKKWWPADCHIIGKDITRFHCVIWPAMLMSAGIELPKTIFGHGFVYLKGEKMSKSLGNVVTPIDVIEKVGADPLRYYLMRGGSFGRDGDFTWDHFIERYNGDLANGIGNLVSRTIGMVHRFQGGSINVPKAIDASSELAKITIALMDRVAAALGQAQDVEFHNALAAIWEVIATADRHINDHKPWELAKLEKTEEINRVLWDVASALRVITIALKPFIPSTAEKIWALMGFDTLGNFADQMVEDGRGGWARIDREIKVKELIGLFPRIEEERAEQPVKKEGKKAKPKEERAKMDIQTQTPVPAPTQAAAGLLDISDFAKIDLRVAEVISAERVEGADKLLKLQVNLGSEQRQIVAGIAKHYTPEELVGKRIIVVVNLKPAKLRGVESQGMLLAASDETTVSILTPLKDVAIGSKVK